jgi:hypothetical protein
MRRWFLSYHSPDQALAERLKAAIEHKDSPSRVFFAPMHLRAGGSWSGPACPGNRRRVCFHSAGGEKGLGPWQVYECDEALDKPTGSGCQPRNPYYSFTICSCRHGLRFGGRGWALCCGCVPLMNDSAECRDRAKECADHASTETTRKLRSLYSDLARSWAMLANQIDRQTEARRDLTR